MQQRVESLAFFGASPEEHHHPAHEWTSEERQEWENRIHIYLPRRDEEPEDSGSTEENE